MTTRTINGPEAKLPDGQSFLAADGARRKEIRVQWWRDLRGANYREAVFPASDLIPELPMEDPGCRDYPVDAPPVFFGHYAVQAHEPASIRHNVACLDYGMGKGGFLCAYRWDGEQEIRPEGFVRAFISENEEVIV